MNILRRFELFCIKNVWWFFALIWIMFMVQFVVYIPYFILIFLTLWILWGIGMRIPQRICYSLRRRWWHRKKAPKTDAFMESL